MRDERVAVELVQALPENWAACRRYRFALTVDRMPDGSMLAIPVNVLAGRRAQPVALAVAGHHGDEHEGPAALAHLWRELDPATLAGTALLVPILNPPAFRANARKGPDDRVDINRIFPGDAQGTITHRIAHRFMKEIAGRADFIVSMHGWSTGYVVLPYVEFPSKARTTEASRQGATAFGLEYLNPLEAGPGRLLTEASVRGIPIIEVEIGGMGVTTTDGRLLYERGVVNLLRHLGLADGAVAAGRRRLVSRHEIPAPTGGLFLREVEVGDVVNVGQRLATIADLHAEPVASVTATASGVVGVLCMTASVSPGQLVVTIFSVDSDA
jgi:predicted deacylase